MEPIETVAVSEPALDFRAARLYLVCAALVLGNLALPWAVHSIPGAGPRLLPILFFTLVAGWRFGFQAALLTGLASPLASHALTGMPAGAALQTLVLQSVLLGALAALGRTRPVRLPRLAAVVVAHQILCLLPVLLLAGHAAAWAGFTLHVPGMLLQVLGGWGLLALLDRVR